MLSVSFQGLFVWLTQKLSLADLHKIAAAMMQELLSASITAINTSLGDHAFFNIQDCFSGAFLQGQAAEICVLLKLIFSNSSLLLFLLKQEKKLFKITQEGIVGKTPTKLLLINNIKIMLLCDLFTDNISSAMGCLVFPHAAYASTEMMANHI